MSWAAEQLPHIFDIVNSSFDPALKEKASSVTARDGSVCVVTRYSERLVEKHLYLTEMTMRIHNDVLIDLSEHFYIHQHHASKREQPQSATGNLYTEKNEAYPTVGGLEGYLRLLAQVAAGYA